MGYPLWTVSALTVIPITCASLTPRGYESRRCHRTQACERFLMTTTTSVPEAILEAVGGPGNISSLTHCATRLRFELHDASVVDKATVEAIPGVMGAVPQSGDRYQIVIGGAVQGVYTQIMNLPAMTSGASRSDADVKAAARAKARARTR